MASTPLYVEKDYVDVVDEDGNDLGSVPKSWLDTDLLPVGTKKASSKQSKADDPVEVPDGEPVEKWTVEQLDAYAEREGIDLTGAPTKKAERLEVIQKAIEAKAAANNS